MRGLAIWPGSVASLTREERWSELNGAALAMIAVLTPLTKIILEAENDATLTEKISSKRCLIVSSSGLHRKSTAGLERNGCCLRRDRAISAPWRNSVGSLR